MMREDGAYRASPRAAIDAGRMAASYGARSAYIVFDRRVRVRAESVAKGLEADGIRLLGRTGIAGGEGCKCMTMVMRLHSRMVSAGADRATLVVVVGGGTVTDVSGFAAATYMRGVPWLPVATTVLGMVDAAIGGKTGIDLPEGKNLVGAFWQPIGVVADLSALATLPVLQRRTGMAEIIKSAVIGDAGLLGLCEGFEVSADARRWLPLLQRAACVKLRIVAADTRECGRRATLNFGHTVGHALETVSGYRLSHGAAVAVGMRAAGLIARERGEWSARAHSRVLKALSSVGLATHTGKGFSSARVLAAMRRDKKRSAGTHRMVLPVRIGRVVTGVEVAEEEIRRALTICRLPACADELEP
jgi:3-dehydroquinate synthase